MFPSFFLPVFAVSIFFCGMYGIALWKKDNSIADVAWGLGFIIVAVTGLLANRIYSLPALMIMVLVSIWGLRLALHIFQRNKGKGEDFRYKEWRAKWGKLAWLKSFFYVFFLQAILLLVISLPIQLVMLFPPVTGTFPWQVIVGLLIWGIGYFFESQADAQLITFKQNPENKGKILTTGVWALSRHPNYFGESLMWWGIAVIACSVPHGYFGLLGALTITLMVRFVSGVPLLEKKYEGRKDWEEYVKKTPVFFPKMGV